MLTSAQKHWDVEQWTHYLKVQELPVMPRTKGLLDLLVEHADTVAPKRLVELANSDSFLALRLLRYAEAHRSHHLGRESTTPLSAILHTGTDNLITLIADAPVCNEDEEGLLLSESRCARAGVLARQWAGWRADISPEEVALAALLAEMGEMLLWHFAPEIPLAVQDEMASGRATRTLQAQQQVAGFAFKTLSLSLAAAWHLPPLIAMLIKGVDNIRANIARIANDTARHLQSDPENPAIPSDIIALHHFLPNTSYATLLAPLDLSEKYRDEVLVAIARENEHGQGAHHS
ncbi:HDOD domain-containing protein [Silvimonas amylolytica]|uniref:HDOD domain-containing protein n=1 Tax=Silvimonas amylolytica TaxID=449663 RepID=A0ABQ2PSD2_9NEIS|nr:HDOD domain-containing protein [Silvimonas amylolytica]GGP28140.1 hypothetical protein GCM10010971_39590 [Silvimonas amylolytica]